MVNSTHTLTLLEQSGVNFKKLTQPHATISIEETAAARGIDPSSMLKSVLLRDLDNNLYLVCTRGTSRVHPPTVRTLFSCRRMTSVAFADVEPLSGYTPGTLNPLALSSSVVRVFDESIQPTEQVTISSGDLLLGLQLNYADLIALVTSLGHPKVVGKTQ